MCIRDSIFLSQDTETGMLEADGSIHGRFPQASGFTYVYDLTQPASSEYDKDALTMPETIGTRVQSITLEDGTVLDKNDNETKLMLVASAYEIGGGDSYWMLGALNEAEDLGGYQYIPEIATPAGNYGDAVTDYVNAVYGGKLPADAYPLASGRIQILLDGLPGKRCIEQDSIAAEELVDEPGDRRIEGSQRRQRKSIEVNTFDRHGLFTCVVCSPY